MPGLLKSIHPAPLPATPNYPGIQLHQLPPKLLLVGSKARRGGSCGILLSWNTNIGALPDNISRYEVYVYREMEGPVNSSLWRKLGDIHALSLPIGITITHFVAKNRYHFTIRAVDSNQRCGPFSEPVSISYS